jgi:hypothetical protein
METYLKSKYYNSDVQIGAMKSLYPQFKVKKRGQFEIEFTGELQAKPELPIYTISIEYLGDNTPKVKVIRPVLVENPPHFYTQSNTLCLYHPNDYKWRKERLVAKDIVSWTAAWIYFYEAWLQHKVWLGPEADHSAEKNLLI